MTEPINVHIIGVPITCKDGVKDTWRQVADWVAKQLAVHYRDSVCTEYFDLFDANCPPIPEAAQLPVVLVNGRIVSSGGKISIPVIRKYLDGVGVKTIHSNRKCSTNRKCIHPIEIWGRLR